LVAYFLPFLGVVRLKTTIKKMLTNTILIVNLIKKNYISSPIVYAFRVLENCKSVFRENIFRIFMLIWML